NRKRNFSVDNCYITFNSSTWRWESDSTICGRIVLTYLTQYLGYASFSVTITLDFIALVILRKSNKAHALGRVMESDYMRRRKNEAKFLIQALLQSGLLLYALLGSYHIYTLVESNFLMFLIKTMSCQGCHALDGFIIALIHFHKRHFFCKKDASVSHTVGTRT
ncbi:hypothetical protein OESDEN_18016, partial [Oesophagostomum dentatum]